MRIAKHTTVHEHARKRRVQAKLVPVIVIFCVCMMIVALLLALWNYGLLFPSWVQWHTFSQEVDVNGDGRVEAVNLMNRHLVVVDSEDNEYVTPQDWMVADVELGDLTGDGVPEILVLTWEHTNAGESAVLELPLLGRAFGFNQHMHVFDYIEGNARHLWDSAPLHLEVCSIHMASEGVVCVTLPNGEMSYWRWQNPGFALQGERAFDDSIVRLD